MISEKEFLAAYHPDAYERPSVTSDILVFTTKQHQLYILLIRRSEPPYADKWAVPGGFIRMNETAEQTAVRKLREETGIAGDIYLEQLQTFSAVDRDPRMRILSVAYIAMIPENKLDYAPGERTSEIALFEVRRGLNTDIQLCSEEGFVLTKEDIAFDHYEMICAAIHRMEGKLDYTDIAFSFLEDPQFFTLTDLREIYDAIAGKRYDIGNFRRFIINRYVETGTVREIPGASRKERGRPAVIYRFDKKKSLC